MERKDGGSNVRSPSMDEKAESNVCVHQQPGNGSDSLAHYNPSDVIHRHNHGYRGEHCEFSSVEAGEATPHPAGCGVSARGEHCTGLETTMLNSLPENCGTAHGHNAADGIFSDSSKNGLSRSTNAGSRSASPGPDTTNTHCTETHQANRSWNDEQNNFPGESNEVRMKVRDKNDPTGYLDAVSATVPSAPTESRNECCNGVQDIDHSCEGEAAPNWDGPRKPEDLSGTTFRTQTSDGRWSSGDYAKHLNGVLLSGEGCHETQAPTNTGEGGCLTFSISQMPLSAPGNDVLGQGGFEALSEEKHCSGTFEPPSRTQQNPGEPPGETSHPSLTPLDQELSCCSKPNLEPSFTCGAPSLKNQAEVPSLSSQGPPRPPTLGPRSLPCSVSCDSPQLSLASRLEAGSDEAFEDPQQDQDMVFDHRFLDVGLGSRNTYECSRRQSAPGQLPQGEGIGMEEELQSKKPSMAEYFGRGLFTRKQRPASESVPGWKLFGKVPPRESPTKTPRTIQQEYEARHQTTAGNSPTQQALGRSRKNLEFEPLSTTALILEDRPANLPAKSLEEAQRHRQQYDQMVASARRSELKEVQKRQRQMKERFKQEENISIAMVTWNNHILPEWDTMRTTRRARELWWQGLPPNVRGRVWSLAIGNELNITPELYGIFLSRAKEKWKGFTSETEGGAVEADRESSLELIKLDISRTFPSLFIFQKGGPYYDILHSLLGAYACYRPDVGYVQGMSFIAAMLILNLEECDAFISFANLLNKPCQMAFFRVDHPLMLRYFSAFEVFFEESLPSLFSHFQSAGLTPDLYLIDWIFSLYTKSLPLDVACRVWDVFCRDGEEFLFRTALGILRLYQDVLLHMDFIHMAQFLARLPDEELLSDRLFSCIAATPMISGNRKWNQVFTALIKDGKDADKTVGPSQKS